MEAKNTIRRIWWFNAWQIQDIEGWLADMSAQGWHFISSGRYFAKFIKGEPQDYCYLYSAFPAKTKEESIAERQQDGWEYIASKGPTIHFFRLPGSDTSDYELQQERTNTIGVLQKQTIGNMLTSFLGASAPIITQFLTGGVLVLLITDLGLIAITVFLTSLISGIRGLCALFGSKRRIRWGEALPPSESFADNLARRKIIKVSVTLVLLVVFVPNIVGIGIALAIRNGPPPEEMPVLQMSDIFQDLPLSINESYLAHSSLLVPNAWELHQTHEENELIVKGYRARNSLLANLIAEDVASSLWFGTRSDDDLEVSNLHEIDFIWIQDSNLEQRKEFIILKDVYVFHVTYWGVGLTLEDLIEMTIEHATRGRQ